MSTFRLGDWEVDPERNRIRRGARAERLQPRQMDLLVRLAAARGQVVTKRQLMRDVWSDGAVVDHVLPKTVSSLRRALGESARSPRLIETVPKRGYRLLADAPPEPAPHSRRVAAPRSRRPFAIARAAMLVGLPLVAGAHLPESPAAPGEPSTLVALSPDETGLPLRFEFAVATRHEIVVETRWRAEPMAASPSEPATDGARPPDR